MAVAVRPHPAGNTAPAEGASWALGWKNLRLFGLHAAGPVSNLFTAVRLMW